MPIRKIVVVRSHEWLGDAWNRRSFGVAGPQLESAVKVPGVNFVESAHPVPVFEPGGVAPATRGPLTYGGASALAKPRHSGYAVVGLFDDEEAVSRIKQDRADQVVGVFADPRIQGCPVYCHAGPVGTYANVAQKIGGITSGGQQLTGKGIRVAIVDTGIHGAHPSPAGRSIQQSIDSSHAFSPTNPVYAGGNTPINHGTMVAFDVLIGAPDAVLIDYALLQSDQATWGGFLSDAVAAFGSLIDYLTNNPGPLVVNNSWGLFDRSDDAPLASDENYSANPNHPFNQITGALVAAGADVVFAAGNCGADCPDGRCGFNDQGPGASIHGANSHPAVITVAALTVNGERLGYSSQGPGGLSNRKPDVAGYSHFAGSGVYEADGGTSAASPVVAGAVAALREGWPDLSPAILKGVLQQTAEGADHWNYDLGFGVIDPAAAAVGAAGAAARITTTAAAALQPYAATTTAGKAWMLKPLSDAERARYLASLQAGSGR